MLKANNRNTRTRCEIRSKLTIKIHCSSASIVNCEHVIPGWVLFSLNYNKHGRRVHVKRLTFNFFQV